MNSFGMLCATVPEPYSARLNDEFGSSLGIPEKRTLATLIYYPELKIKQIEGKLTQRENLEDWYKVTIFRLIRVCKNASSKYTRSKVRKSLPKDFAYIIEELMTGRPDVAIRKHIIMNHQLCHPHRQSRTADH